MNYKKIINTAHKLRNEGNTKQSFKEYKKLIKSKDLKIQIDGYKGMALCSKMDHNLKNTLKYYAKAEKIVKKNNDLSSLGDIYRDVGLSHEYFAKYKFAEKFLKKSLDTFESLKMTQLNYAKLGITEVKLGMTYVHQKKLQKAEKWFRKGDRHLAKYKQADFWRLTSKMHFAELLYVKKKYKQVINKITPLLIESMNKNWSHRYVQILSLKAACLKKIKKEAESKHDIQLISQLLLNLDSREVANSVKKKLGYYLKH